MVMEDGDDAKAIEASLAENIARLPMDEIDQYKAFAALRKEGLGVADIAVRFGVTERLVEQRLAIANIITPILNAYRREDIDPGTLQVLTMATPRQQKAWWALFQSEDEHAPTGRALKNWLFGGSQIQTSNALFDIAAYDGAIIANLFGTEEYFADTVQFWTLQNAAIAELKSAYLDAGWSDVVQMDIGHQFASWNHVETTKRKGGKVFISVSGDGEVTAHEGWLSQIELKKQAKAQEAETNGGASSGLKQERPELTAAMSNYLGLHRHAAVRTELLSHPALTLRLTVAHIIAGSPLWRVEAEGQRPHNEAIGTSLASSKAQDAFAAEQDAVLKMLGWQEPDSDIMTFGTVASGFFGNSVEMLFDWLMTQRDDDVMRILTLVMAETLAAREGTRAGFGRQNRLGRGPTRSAESLPYCLVQGEDILAAVR